MVEPLKLVVQGTPNPNAIKLTLNRVVATGGQTYRDAATTQVAWAKALLEVTGITQVYALHNFIAVTKTAETEWSVLVPQVEGVLQAAFANVP